MVSAKAIKSASYYGWADMNKGNGYKTIAIATKTETKTEPAKCGVLRFAQNDGG
jgi:hypothetical protein